MGRGRCEGGRLGMVVRYVWGYSNLIDSVHSEIRVLWEQYAMEDDNLTQGALKLKYYLLENISCVD